MCPSWINTHRSNSTPELAKLSTVVITIFHSFSLFLKRKFITSEQLGLNNVMFIFPCLWALYNGIISFIVFCDVLFFFPFNIVTKIHTCYVYVLLLSLLWVTTIYPFSCCATFGFFSGFVFAIVNNIALNILVKYLLIQVFKKSL